ncbi:MAG: alpha/beta hydrolase-fold protein, partial [Gemmatimonadota bacterium]|nr:alpha/beta hydrolase-fold protein [Gemmatimonadota bacterium]
CSGNARWTLELEAVMPNRTFSRVAPVMLAALCSLACAGTAGAGTPPRFAVTVAAAARAQPVTGRLIVLLSKRDQPEPRFLASPTGPAMFAIDLDQLKAGTAAIVDDHALGYPGSLSAIPAGDYYAQAIINVYEQAKRSDGHTVWLHLNDGNIETFASAAGNIYSDVQKVHVGDGGEIKITINHLIAAQPRPTDTDWIKYVRVQSDRLTKFWGRPTYVNAVVLLPKGYAEHPNVRYPVVYPLGHSIPFSFTTDSARAGGQVGKVSEVTGTESGFDFYKQWISDGYPRFIAITLEQQTPYFPDSYSVNSANNGPYGDAIVEEVMPYLETHFRAIDKPYARLIEGASTSGWQTLALQLQHPDFFGGAWIFQPDPIDFKRYQQIDIYQDSSAFTLPIGQFNSYERPFRRTVQGQVVWTARQLSLFEEVLGTHGRSSYQYGAWEAVYGPVGDDGYPKPLWNNLTGTIDHDVASYWRDHGYDLRAYAEKNWATIGPKVVGKLHFSAGDMDDFYLNLAVYQFEDFLKHTTNPHYEGEFTYGRPMKGHSWHGQTWAELVKRMGAYVRDHAPAGEKTSEWMY